MRNSGSGLYRGTRTAVNGYRHSTRIVKSMGEDVLRAETVKIDLKNPFDFTEENVGRLLASRDDSEHSQLCVTRDGFAFIRGRSKEDVDSLLFRLESWVAGNGYVGPEAADDPEWRKRIFNVLKSNWPKPSSSYIDVF